MDRAFIFPGQGSQKVGMGHDVSLAFPAARQVFEEVDEALKENLSKTIFSGPEHDLLLTRNTQPALMAVSMAIIRVIEHESGQNLADIVGALAGHSLGEYSALAASGAITLTDTARLLRLRGEYMQAAVPMGEGAMAALLGADLKIALEIAKEAQKVGVCTIANDNAPGQIVLSGSKAAIDAAVIIAKKEGVKKAIILPVSAPFHCPLMAPAAEKMALALQAIDLRQPRIPLIANVNAEFLTDRMDIRALLEQQVTGVVRWRECVLGIRDAGMTSFVEVGAGNVLKSLTRRIDRELNALSLGTVDEIDGFLKAL